LKIRTRDSSGGLGLAINQLKAYHHQISKDAARLVKADFTHILEEEKFADQYNSNSPASKRRQAERFALHIELYQKLRADMIDAINALIAEKIKTQEQDIEQEKQLREEKERMAHLGLTQELSTKKNVELQTHYMNKLDQLKKEYERSIEHVKKYIVHLTELIAAIKENQKEHKQTFLDQFYQAAKTILLENFKQVDENIIIPVGSQKILINLDRAIKSMMQGAENAFDKKEPHIDQLKTHVENQFAHCILEESRKTNNPLTETDVNLVASNIASNLADKQQGIFEKAVHIDCIQSEVLNAAKSELEIAKQEKEILQAQRDSLEMDFFSENSLENIEEFHKKILDQAENFLKEADQMLHTEKRITTALLAFGNRELPKAANSPVFDEAPSEGLRLKHG